MGELHIEINGEIGNAFFGEAGGVTAKSIAEKITKNKKAETIILNIDSPGGSVYEGYAISNIIFEQRAKGKRVEAVIKGMCASIATLIALSTDKVTMLPFSSWMVHNPFVGLQGDAEELRKAATELEKIQNKLIEVYSKKTGKATEEIQALMREERTLSAREARELGFADEVIEEVKAVAYWKNKETSLDMEDKALLKKLSDGIESIQAKFAKVFKAEGDVTPVAVTEKLKDGTDVVIEPGVQEGATAMIAGAPAPDGDHELENGKTITVKDGLVTTVKEPAAPAEDAGALKKENEELKAKLAEAETKALEQAKAITDQKTAVEDIKKEIQNLKKLTVGGTTPPAPEQKFKGTETVTPRAEAFNKLANSIKK